MPFCIKCGDEIPAGAAFCPSCGAPVTVVVVAPSVESALFTIDGQKGLSRHLLVFTDRRLIVALVGGGATRLLTAGVLRMAYEGSKIKKMKQKDIEELMSDKKTYAIPYDEISSIEVAKGGRLKAGSIKVNRTVGKPEKFNIDIKKRIDDFERLMKPVFGERLVVKR